MNRFVKDPAASLDYMVDWSAYLGTDTISISTFTADTGLVVGSDANTATTATVWLSGGTVGTTYSITNHITTVGNRTDERTFKITVQER